MTDPATPDPAAILHQDCLVWDAHSCLPLKMGTNMSVLERHRAAGVDFVSLNIGMDMTPLGDVMTVLAYFRTWFANSAQHYRVVSAPGDVSRAMQEGQLAVAFDLEGALPIGDQLAVLPVLQKYGVRQMHMIYNRSNAVGGGCHDTDQGLTPFGRQMVGKLNDCGITVDCSHAGERTSLDIMAASTKPVVFSHANARALCDHARNISDAQIDACAATGGVIGINGVGLFLGGAIGGLDGEAKAIARHIDYVVQRVGPDHVGLGLDYSYESDTAEDMAGGPVDAGYWWPEGLGYDFSTLRFAPPEVLPRVTAELLGLGYQDHHVRAILGGNFLRVAKATWA